MDHGFEICFLSRVIEDDFLSRFEFVREKAPRLPKDCLTFGQNLCEESSYKDLSFLNIPFYLKPLVRLLASGIQL